MERVIVMVQFATIEADISGDVGGLGISRMHFQRQDAGTITVADCNAAGAAWRGLWFAAHSEVPITVTINFQPSVQVREVDTGAPDSVLLMSTPPAAVTGSSTSHYAAGNGARVNWLSASVRNRRFMRSATFLVPLTVDAFSATGVLNSVQGASYATAAAGVINALTSASLEMIAWHRPPKGTHTGGAAGLITGTKVNATGAVLRSRRT